MGIGERVRKRRVELGLTRNELAEKLLLHPPLLQTMKIISVFRSRNF